MAKFDVDAINAQVLDLMSKHGADWKRPWIERADSDTEEILADVSRGNAQYTLASSTEFALNRIVHPELAIALDLSPERAIAWVVSTSAHDRSLLDRVNAFFAGARSDGLPVVQRLGRGPDGSPCGGVSTNSGSP